MGVRFSGLTATANNATNFVITGLSRHHRPCLECLSATDHCGVGSHLQYNFGRQHAVESRPVAMSRARWRLKSGTRTWTSLDSSWN